MAASAFCITSNGTILYSSTADLFEQLLRLVGILHGRQLDQNPVGADVADRRLGDAEAVDAPIDDLARLRLDLAW